MSVHRTLGGRWVRCPVPEICELPFHLPGMTVTEAEALPLQALLPLLNVVEPPISTHEDGSMYWEDAEERLHRDYDLPAAREFDGEYGWYRHGLLHRDGDKPALIRPSGYRQWHKNGQLHRDGDLPAIVGSAGMREWYQHGQLHRENGPASISADGSEEWYRHGLLHREGGPAISYPDGTQVWALDGVTQPPPDKG